MNNFNSNYKAFKTAYYLVIITTIFDALSIFSTYIQYSNYKSFRDVTDLSSLNLMQFNKISADFQLKNSFVILLGTLLLIISILSIIFFAIWFSKLYKNVYTRREQKPKYGPGMAAGGLFIPLANIWIPVTILSEIAKEYTSIIRKKRNNYILSPIHIGAWSFLYFTGLTAYFIFATVNMSKTILPATFAAIQQKKGNIAGILNTIIDGTLNNLLAVGIWKVVVVIIGIILIYTMKKINDAEQIIINENLVDEADFEVEGFQGIKQF